jgi:hypothetical protein
LFVLEGKRRAVGIRFLFVFFFLFLGFFIFAIFGVVGGWVGGKNTSDVLKSIPSVQEVEVRQVSEGRLDQCLQRQLRVIVGIMSVVMLT